MNVQPLKKHIKTSSSGRIGLCSWCGIFENISCQYGKYANHQRKTHRYTKISVANDWYNGSRFVGIIPILFHRTNFGKVSSHYYIFLVYYLLCFILYPLCDFGPKNDCILNKWRKNDSFCTCFIFTLLWNLMRWTQMCYLYDCTIYFIRCELYTLNIACVCAGRQISTLTNVIESLSPYRKSHLIRINLSDRDVYFSLFKVNKRNYSVKSTEI